MFFSTYDSETDTLDGVPIAKLAKDSKLREAIKSADEREMNERLYIGKMTELQTRWKNPIDGDWDYVHDFTDDELENGIRETVGQLRFEKAWSAIKIAILLAILAFAVFNIWTVVGILLALLLIGLLFGQNK